MSEDPKHISEFMRSFGFQDLTDEEWARRDAEIEAARKLEDEKPENKARILAEKKAWFTDRDWPVRAIEAAIEADTTKAAVMRIAAWDPEVENVLVLSGPAGCGKTVAAAWWGWTSKYSPRFLRSTSFAAASRYDSEKRDQWLGARALVLDDLGAEYADSKGNYLVDLDELVDVFYGDKKPLLITTNASAEEFKSRYGQRIADRVRECGTFASIAGGSLRRKL